MAADALRSLLFEMKFWVRYALLPRSRYVAVYYPTPERTVERMLKLAECTAQDTVFDLGCGDGRVIVAAGKLGARGVGYELDRDLVEAARKAVREHKLEDRCLIHQADAGTADVSTASIIALYLSDKGNSDLLRRVGGTLRPGTRVVSNFFPVAGWDRFLLRTDTSDPTTGPIHLYRYAGTASQADR